MNGLWSWCSRNEQPLCHRLYVVRQAGQSAWRSWVIAINYRVITAMKPTCLPFRKSDPLAVRRLNYDGLTNGWWQRVDEPIGNGNVSIFRRLYQREMRSTTDLTSPTALPWTTTTDNILKVSDHRWMIVRAWGCQEYVSSDASTIGEERQGLWTIQLKRKHTFQLFNYHLGSLLFCNNVQSTIGIWPMSAPVDTNVSTVGLFVWFHSVLGMAAGAAQWAYLFVWTSIVVRFKAMKVPFRYTFL